MNAQPAWLGAPGFPATSFVPVHDPAALNTVHWGEPRARARRSGAGLNEITKILLECRDGDTGAFDRLFPHVYEELRRRARSYMKSERGGHTLQTTGLVHEAYLKLIDAEIPWQDRAHFFAVAARSMRRILVDHARGRQAARRGGGDRPVSLDEATLLSAEPSGDVLALDEALDRLVEFDERKSRIVELRFFAGLTHEEIAKSLDVSLSTVEREMRLARAWLHREITGEP